MLFSFSDYFSKNECQARDIVLSALGRLQSDPDRDVRYFAGRRDSYDINLHDSDIPERLTENNCNTVDSDHEDRHTENVSADNSDSNSLLSQPELLQAEHSQNYQEEKQDSQTTEESTEKSECESSNNSPTSTVNIHNLLNGENENVDSEPDESSEDLKASISEKMVNHCEINIIIPTAENDSEGLLAEDSENPTELHSFPAVAVKVSDHGLISGQQSSSEKQCFSEKGRVALHIVSEEKVRLSLAVE